MPSDWMRFEGVVIWRPLRKKVAQMGKDFGGRYPPARISFHGASDRLNLLA